MNKSTDFVISTHGLAKTYKGVNALNSLNLTVPRNSIFGFLGPNGAGKSTTCCGYVQASTSVGSGNGETGMGAA